MYSNLEIKASLPTLQACITQLIIYVPIVQYCKNGRVLAWIKKATPSFPAHVISANYAPSFTVHRNLTKNPLSADCNKKGDTVEVYPSERDIERYLPLKGLRPQR